MYVKKAAVSLLYAWLDSIASFRFGKVKLALFGLYRALRDSYWVLSTKFWWLPVIFIIISRHIHKIPLQIGHIDIFGVIWSVITVLAVRSSVGQKSYRYFMSFWHVVVAACALALLLYSIKPFLAGHWIGFFSLAIGVYSPLFLCCIFFVSDSVRSYHDIGQSIWHGIKMVIYNYPLFLFVHVVLFILWQLVVSLTMFTAVKPLALYYIRMLLLPVYVSTIHTLYIVRRHEQRELYQER